MSRRLRSLGAHLKENLSITRVFVRFDRSVYIRISHPFTNDHGRVTIIDFGEALPGYLTRLADAFHEELEGPLCVAMAVTDLARKPDVAWAFPHVSRVASPPLMVKRLDDVDASARFQEALLRSSRYG